ncbi:MAG: tetratricopeptide repeat protein, partial [Nitrospinota bacterium]|nr:tetratricopeptide repeat protein [Nitrospinota bacterium]
REAIRLDPEYAFAHNNLGLIYLRRSQNHEAEQMIRKTIALKPDYASGYYNLGLIYAANSNYIDAIHSYEEAIHLDPGMKEARQKLKSAEFWNKVHTFFGGMKRMIAR